jgi:hypothetical protein
MRCTGCVRPIDLGPLCQGECEKFPGPCNQKVTARELNKAKFSEICAWCGGLCCFSGVSCRYLISDETLEKYDIHTKMAVPCAALNSERGCRLPRKARPRPCLMWKCHFVQVIKKHPEMWPYCRAHAKMVNLSGQLMCRNCNFWSHCPYSNKTQVENFVPIPAG